MLVRFTSGTHKSTQQNYSMIKKEISEFQEDLLNKKFLLRVYNKSMKESLGKDVKNLASKHIFAWWHAILLVFNFSIEYVKGQVFSWLLTRNTYRSKGPRDNKGWTSSLNISLKIS